MRVAVCIQIRKKRFEWGKSTLLAGITLEMGMLFSSYFVTNLQLFSISTFIYALTSTTQFDMQINIFNFIIYGSAVLPFRSESIVHRVFIYVKTRHHMFQSVEFCIRSYAIRTHKI